MAILILDFDHTLVNGHTHNLLARYFPPYKNQWTADEIDKQWALVRELPPVKSAKVWKELIESWQKKGHQVAIASFSCYPGVIFRFLQETIGLSENALQAVFIEAWLPDNPLIGDKNTHILNILAHFNYEGPKEAIVFVDDSMTNTRAATKQGYTVIKAHDRLGFPLKNADHVEQIIDYYKKLI